MILREGNRNVSEAAGSGGGEIINFGSRKCYKLDGSILHNAFVSNLRIQSI